MKKSIGIWLAVLLTAGNHLMADIPTVSRQTANKHTKIHPVGVGDVRWTEGFWAERFAVCRDSMIPNMWNIFQNPEISHAYMNFRVAAGLEEGEHHGPKFNDGDFYKWLEAVAYTYGVTKDPQLDRLMDEIINVIARSQREDGYLHTPVIIEQKLGTARAGEWQDQLHFETYNIGHLMTTACIHHRATGKESLLDVAKKAADYLYTVCMNHPQPLADSTICPSHYMGVVDMYRETGEARYLELAERLIGVRDLTSKGTDHNQDRIPFRQQVEAVGHAVRANYLYAGAADVYLETGDETLWTPLDSIWRDVTYRKMYVTGSTGAIYDGASPDGSRRHHDIQLVHQAYGRPYQLPNVTAYNETCATIGNALWNWRMLQATGDARFADVLELTLYNGVLPGISLDGTKFFYTNPLRHTHDLPFDLRWSGGRKSYISSFCCPPNVVRVIAESGDYAYGVSDKSIWVNLYGGSKLDTRLKDGSRVTLTQETGYPWNGDIKITINEIETTNFALMLRVPGWADEAGIKVNGNNIDTVALPGTYASVQRDWSPGDSVELHIPMTAKLLESHPLVEETRNQVAVKRGPLVYCLESNDLPDGIDVSDVVIPRGIRFEPKMVDGELGEIMTLNGTAIKTETGDWSDQLYRELSSDSPQAFGLSLIPHYAWANRGDSEMTVWMPVR